MCRQQLDDLTQQHEGYARQLRDRLLREQDLAVEKERQAAQDRLREAAERLVFGPASHYNMLCLLYNATCCQALHVLTSATCLSAASKGEAELSHLRSSLQHSQPLLLPHADMCFACFAQPLKLPNTWFACTS